MITAIRQRLRVVAADESGLTIIEVLAASVIMVIGALAILQTIDASTRNSFRAEQSQVAISQVQRELEAVRALAFEDLALTATPSSSAEPNNPGSRVSGSKFRVEKDGTEMADLVINGGLGQDDQPITGGLVNPGPEPYTAGDTSGKIYRYVFWQNDPDCSEIDCPGAKDYKRVVIAITVDKNALSFDRNYVEIASEFTDEDAPIADGPIAENTDDGGGGGGGPAGPSAQQFFLTDTTCNNSTRTATTADHLSHNTLGNCSAGLRTGATIPGAPDLLVRTAPPTVSPVPPLYDFATDVEPATNAHLDKGLQVARRDKNNCTFNPSSFKMVHRWVTTPMTSAYAMSGSATLVLWTRSLNAAVHKGELCSYLYVMNAAGSISTLDDAGYSVNAWPTNWAEIKLNFAFPGSSVIPVGSRLGVGFIVERKGTTADAMSFYYDHLSYPSRLEVATTTPIP